MEGDSSLMFSGGYKQLEQVGQSGHDGLCLQDVHVVSSELSVHAAVQKDVAALQQSVPDHEQSVGDVVASNKRFKRSENLSATAGEPDSDVVDLSAEALITESHSFDAMEQFTPVENVADPIEEFSSETGAETLRLMTKGPTIWPGIRCVWASTVFQMLVLIATGSLQMMVLCQCAQKLRVCVEQHLTNCLQILNLTMLQRRVPFSRVCNCLQAPQYMWEQNGFLNIVFGQNNIVDELFPQVDLKRPACPLVDLTGDDGYEAPIQKAFMKGQTKQFFLKVFRQSTIANEDTLRTNFIHGWTSIILLNMFAFSAFDKARTECAEHDLRATVHLTVSECLARKTTSTVGKRLGSMRRFVEFCTNSLSPSLLEDRNMHAYLTHLVHDPSSSGSSGKAFLEAVRFTSAMLGLRSDEINSISRNVAGLAEVLVKRAPTIEPAQALSVEQVKTLERSCCTAEPLPDKIILGGVLIMVYGSGTASDMAKAVKLLVDFDPRPDSTDNSSEPRGYIELGVLGQKGARSDTHRRVLLPIVAPLYSLSGTKWWESWIEARQALNLETSGLLDVPLLCRFDGDGQPVSQSMSSSEIGEFLRQVLGLETLRRNKVGSHLCKATILSWLSKFGVDLPTRRLIGHHLDHCKKRGDLQP